MQGLDFLQILLFIEHEQCRPRNWNLPLLHSCVFNLFLCIKTTNFCYNVNVCIAVFYENIGKDEVSVFATVRASVMFHLGSNISTQKSIMSLLLNRTMD